MRTLGVVVLLAAVGCVDRSGGPPGGGPPPPQNNPVVGMPPPVDSPLRLLFSDSEPDLEQGLVSTTFDFAHLRDLWVRTQLPAMAQVGRIRIAVSNPQGTPAYETTVAFSPDPNMTQMMMPNDPHPVTVFKAKQVAGGYACDYPIPIAGTAFTRIPSLAPGTWLVQTSIDGAPGPSSPLTVTFTR